MTNRTRVLVALCATAFVLPVAGCAPSWDRSFFTLKDVLSNPDDIVFSGEKEQTKLLCDGLQGCIEGWTTDQADFLRFESNESAEEFAATLNDDGHNSDRVVIDFARTQPSSEIRRLAVELIDATHSSE